MVKGLRLAAITAVIMLFGTVTVLAAPPAGYTGWSIDGGAPRYYENGVLKTDGWVKYGSVYYYIGADGYVVPGRVLSASAAGDMSLGYTDTDPAAVRYDVGTMVTYPQTVSIIAAQTAAEQAQAAARAAQEAAAAAVNTGATALQVRSGAAQPSEITNDYEAFKYLHPEIVTAYGDDIQGLYGKYLSTYGGAATGGTYLATIARLYAINGNTPHYNQRYEDLHNGTHKAYTGSGEWIIEPCDDYKHNSEGYRKCSKCGHVFRHLSLNDYN